MKNLKNLLTALEHNGLFILSVVLLPILAASCSKEHVLMEADKAAGGDLQLESRLKNSNTVNYEFKDSINSGAISSLSTIQQQLFWTIVSAVDVADAQEGSFSAWDPYMAVNEDLLSTVEIPHNPLTHILNAWPGEAYPTNMAIMPSYSFTNIMDIVPSLSTIITDMQGNYANNYTIYIFARKVYSMDPNISTPTYEMYITYAPLVEELWIPVFEDPYTPPPATPNPSIQIYFTKGPGDPEITIIYPL